MFTGPCCAAGPLESGLGQGPSSAMSSQGMDTPATAATAAAYTTAPAAASPTASADTEGADHTEAAAEASGHSVPVLAATTVAGADHIGAGAEAACSYTPVPAAADAAASAATAEGAPSEEILQSVAEVSAAKWRAGKAFAAGQVARGRQQARQSLPERLLGQVTVPSVSSWPSFPD